MCGCARGWVAALARAWLRWCVAVQVCGCVDEWMRGCVDAWVGACMGARMLGCVDVWLRAWVRGCLGAWLRGCVGAWVRGCLAARVCGCVGAWVVCLSSICVYARTSLSAFMCAYVLVHASAHLLFLGPRTVRWYMLIL